MRDIPVGNGSLLVTFDDKYQIRAVYFPRVGQENHTEGFPFRFGIWEQVKFVEKHGDSASLNIGLEAENQRGQNRPFCASDSD